MRREKICESVNTGPFTYSTEKQSCSGGTFGRCLSAWTGFFLMRRRAWEADKKKFKKAVYQNGVFISKQTRIHIMNQMRRFDNKSPVLVLNSETDQTTAAPLRFASFTEFLLGEKWLIARFEKCNSDPRMTAFELFFFDWFPERLRGSLSSQTQVWVIAKHMRLLNLVFKSKEYFPLDKAVFCTLKQRIQMFPSTV